MVHLILGYFCVFFASVGLLSLYSLLEPVLLKLGNEHTEKIVGLSIRPMI